MFIVCVNINTYETIEISMRLVEFSTIIKLYLISNKLLNYLCK